MSIGSIFCNAKVTVKIANDDQMHLDGEPFNVDIQLHAKNSREVA